MQHRWKVTYIDEDNKKKTFIFSTGWLDMGRVGNEVEEELRKLTGSSGNIIIKMEMTNANVLALS